VWSAARYGEIQRKRILDEGTLSAQESEFATRFDPWKNALEKARQPREEVERKDEEKKDEEKEPPVEPKQLEPVPAKTPRTRGRAGGIRIRGVK
jgi:hypothetical protein